MNQGPPSIFGYWALSTGGSSAPHETRGMKTVWQGRPLTPHDEKIAIANALKSTGCDGALLWNPWGFDPDGSMTLDGYNRAHQIHAHGMDAWTAADGISIIATHLDRLKLKHLWYVGCVPLSWDTMPLIALEPLVRVAMAPFRYYVRHTGRTIDVVLDSGSDPNRLAVSLRVRDILVSMGMNVGAEAIHAHTPWAADPNAASVIAASLWHRASWSVHPNGMANPTGWRPTAIDGSGRYAGLGKEYVILAGQDPDDKTDFASVEFARRVYALGSVPCIPMDKMKAADVRQGA